MNIPFVLSTFGLAGLEEIRVALSQAQGGSKRLPYDSSVRLASACIITRAGC
jgi:hypothetical protein